MSKEELNKDKQELLIIAVSTTGTRLTPNGAKHFLQIIEEIEKLQKELEQEKEKNKQLADTNKKLFELGQQSAMQEFINHEYIKKDRIMSLIKETAYTDTYNFKTIPVSKLEELLEGKR